MYEIIAEVVGWALHAAGVIAGTGLVMLLRWQRRIERDLAVLQAHVDEGGSEAIAEVQRDFAKLKLHLAETYIKRDDWVPTVSRVIGMLEDHTEMLVRLEERTRERMAS